MKDFEAGTTVWKEGVSNHDNDGTMDCIQLNTGEQYSYSRKDNARQWHEPEGPGVTFVAEVTEGQEGWERGLRPGQRLLYAQEAVARKREGVQRLQTDENIIQWSETKYYFDTTQGDEIAAVLKKRPLLLTVTDAPSTIVFDPFSKADIGVPDSGFIAQTHFGAKSGAKVVRHRENILIINQGILAQN